MSGFFNARVFGVVFILRKVSIQYNHLNLPKRVTKGTEGYIKYIYDATGRKLRQEVYNNSNALQKSTDYAGEFIYENNVLQFANHEEGRLMMLNNAYEYQYHMKDHLGNVRMTFTTKDKTDEPLATLEDNHVADDQANYLKYADARRIYSTIFDHTNGASPGYAQRLSGTATEKMDLARSIAVMPGDKLKMEVYAKYFNASNSDMASFVAWVASMVSGGSVANSIVDGIGYASSAGSTIPFTSPLNKSNESGSAPKAYLNWVVFDKNYNPVSSVYKRITTAALQTAGADGQHEKLESPELTITEPGFAYIWLSNENGTPVEVYFDDFKVTQVKSPVVQTDDYYPFGLRTSNSYARENSVPNRYTYNGKEEQNELNLGWLDYGARMYMPELGRWPRIDPKAELYFHISPYAYAANTPTNAIDPDGRLVIFINGQHVGSGGKVDYWQKKEMVTRYTSVSFFGQTVWSGNERREEVTADFASGVQDHFNDHSPARFYDGAIGGWGNTIESTFVPQADNLSSGERYAMGQRQGEKDAADIINSLARTGGVITESLKVVSHSMGGAYAKGFVQAIVDYAMAHPEECRGLKISQYDFDPLQGAHLRAIPGVHTEQYSHIKKAGRKGGMGWLANGKQAGLDDEQGAKDGNTYREDQSDASHGVMSFFNDISLLEEGTYVFQNGQWVKQ